MMSEMLTEMVPGQEDSSDLELLQVSFLENMILIPSVLVFLWGVCFVVAHFTAHAWIHNGCELCLTLASAIT